MDELRAGATLLADWMSRSGGRLDPIRTPPSGSEIADWIENNLIITEGEGSGFPFVVRPFQRDFIEAVFDEVEAAIGVLTIARANGKSTLCGGLAAASLAPGSPLARTRGQVVVISSSREQSAIVFDHIRHFIFPDMERNPAGWSVSAQTIRHLSTGSMVTVRASNSSTLQGMSPSLIILDEPTAWNPNSRDRVWQSLETSMGKQPGAKIIVVGTKSTDTSHFFSGLIRGGAGIVVRDYSASENMHELSEEALHAANPMMEFSPTLRLALERERKNVIEGSAAALLAWRQDRLNLGSDHRGAVEQIVEVSNWRSIEYSELPPRDGPVFIGLDIGGASSLTAAALYWPVCGRLETISVVGATPDLWKRGRLDNAGNLYVDMEAEGTLITTPGVLPDLNVFIDLVAARVGDSVVRAVVSDRYKKSETTHAIQHSGRRWPVTVMAVGAGPDGQAAISSFQAEVMSARIRTRRTVAMRHCIAQSRVRYDANGNRRLDKSMAKNRIDALQAAMHCIHYGRQWRSEVESGDVDWLWVPEMDDLGTTW